ncbi:ECs_2282 family putative zinc-binding protein [Pseudomonas oryzihabitans]|uniref:ECs_2282 family putative zinc-binding protein n=1 Tax=Pseudomonas oryzihabitans TaxID=47885 RepID=UPI003CFC6972
MIKIKSVEIQCPQCGNTGFKSPENAQDDDIVTCSFCGLELPIYELKKVAREQATEIIIPELKRAAEEALKKAFKGKGNLK